MNSESALSFQTGKGSARRPMPKASEEAKEILGKRQRSLVRSKRAAPSGQAWTQVQGLDSVEPRQAVAESRMG
jgi:hypothetical protein